MWRTQARLDQNASKLPDVASACPHVRHTQPTQSAAIGSVLQNAKQQLLTVFSVQRLQRGVASIKVKGQKLQQETKQ